MTEYVMYNLIDIDTHGYKIKGFNDVQFKSYWYICYGRNMASQLKV